MMVMASCWVGCATPRNAAGAAVLPASVRPYEIPVVAVLDFENKAPFPRKWDLGSGMRDLLVNELVASRRYTVLTRRDLPSVVSELQNQRQPLFREEGRIATGKLKNARYLIRGAVTDFTHVSGGGVRAAFSRFGLGVKSHLAMVGITLYVIEIESGEIIASESLQGYAPAGGAVASGSYDDVSFGGHAFYETPLGEATSEVLRKAARRIGTAITQQPWHPRVVKVEVHSLILSGGQDRGLQPGVVWEAFQPGERLVDPSTGDVLGQAPPEITGTIRVTDVHDRWSQAEILEGKFQIGQPFRRQNPEPVPRPEADGSLHAPDPYFPGGRR